MDGGKCPAIFISHRHEDKKIADVIRGALEDWGHKSIFQSTDARHGLKIGKPLDPELKSALSETSVVFLIYTVPDQDWHNCMWEYGLATNSLGQEPRLVVFQCAHKMHPSLKHQSIVVVEDSSIEKFADDFHRDRNFFPGHNSSFDEYLSQDMIEKRGQDLFSKLSEIMSEDDSDRHSSF